MTEKLKRIGLYWLPLLLYCLAIFIQSGFDTPGQIPAIPMIDKILHFVAYAIMGILFFRAYGTLPIGNRQLLLVLLSILSAGLYGISDEIHQHFVPSRNADSMDVLADFLGSIGGVAVYYRIIR